MKEIVIICMLIVLSLVIGALFIKIEELKTSIPRDTHALLDNSIRETIKEEFKIDRQNYKLILEPYEETIQSN